jgi:hypothetical protein
MFDYTTFVLTLSLTLESSILIAMRSHLYPSIASQPPPSFNPMDLNVPLDASASTANPDPAVEWECWGEESTIELVEVQLKFDGNVMGMYSIVL